MQHDDDEAFRRPPALPAGSPAGRTWPLIRCWSAREAALGHLAEQRGGLFLFAYEFVRFGVKQAWACLFGGSLLAAILATRLVNPDPIGIARYDLLFVFALGLQVVLLVLRLETLSEAFVILLFHLVAMGMEVFKIAVGSWSYPDAGTLRLLDVPLFAGFMYASVGSYIARAWRLFDFRFSHHPPAWAILSLSLAIYVNFFTHHYVVDLRGVLFAAAAALFCRTTIYFRVWQAYRRMPLLVGLGLVSIFIWFGENIGTFAHAWLYPFQTTTWSLVRLEKLGSWFLLVIISYTLVSLVETPRTVARAQHSDAAGQRRGILVQPTGRRQ